MGDERVGIAGSLCTSSHEGLQGSEQIDERDQPGPVHISAKAMPGGRSAGRGCIATAAFGWIVTRNRLHG